MNMELRATITGLGLCAPGFDHIDAFRAWRANPQRPLPEGRTAHASASRMAPTERRRAPHTIRLALEVASQALGTRDAADVGAVFCSAFGDMANTDAILATLAEAPEQLSPTRFTHSVHNAAAGHWSMAVSSHASTSALACGRDGFASGLLAALLELEASGQPQLLVLFDAADAGALADAAPCASDFAAALLLDPDAAGAGLRLRAHVEPSTCTAPCDERPLPWHAANPAAHVLPLLEVCLDPAPQRFTWPLGSGTLLVLDCEQTP